MQSSNGKQDKLFPKCSGPECWCRDCAYDSIDEVFEPFAKWAAKDEKAFEYASNALKSFYLAAHAIKHAG